MRVGLGVLVLAVAAAGATTSRGRLTAIESRGAGTHELLYLPSGTHLRIASLGQAPLVADLVYLWAIQYYSDYDRADRFRYVDHIFGRVIPELDPQYTDPYWLGALILSTEAHDLDGALHLLDLGFEKNPSEWILPYLAGWECDHAKQFERAASYFERAARAPGAPADLMRLRAGMATRGGNLAEAIGRWREVLDDPRGDDASRSIATRQIRTLQVRLDLEQIAAAVAAYRSRHGAPPARLADLVRDGLLRQEPRDPDGKPYAYDAATGAVTSAAGRVLGS